MTLNISTPLADKWERVPEQYKRLVSEGKMTYREALTYAEAPAKAAASVPVSAVPAKKSLDDTYGAGVAFETGTKRAGQAVDAATLGASLYGAEQAQGSSLAQDESLSETYKRNLAAAEKEKQAPKGMLEQAASFIPQLSALNPELPAELKAAYNTVTQKITGAINPKERLEAQKKGLTDTAVSNLAEIEAAQKILDALPKDQYTPDMIAAIDRGDVLGAIKNMPGSLVNQMVEQTPALLTQLAITGGTALATKNPTATMAAARLSGGIGGYQELGSDFNEVYSQLSEEEKKDPSKVREAFDIALKASTARAVLEGAAPGVGKIAAAPLKSTAGKLGTNVAAQFIGDAGGEAVASTMKGNTASLGEIIAEGIGGTAGVITETHFEQRAAAKEVLKAQQEFDARQKELDDTYAAAKEDKTANQELASQVEAVTKEGAPSIQDMFSGEQVPAEEIAAKQAKEAEVQRLADEAGVDISPVPLSKEQQMEVDNRTVDVLKKQEAGKAKAENKEVEALVQEELGKKKEIQDAEEVLNNKYDIVNVQDIAQEARQRLKLEQDAIANKPFNKTPQGQVLLPAILAKREAVRLPEIKEQVKNERLAKVADAQKVVDSVKEQEVRTQVEAKVAKEAPAAAVEPVQQALPMKYNQQPAAKTKPFKGEPLTAQQQEEEVATRNFEKELVGLPKEEADVLRAEQAKATTSIVKQEKAKEKAQGAVYAKAEGTARATITQQVAKELPDATPVVKGIEIAKRMATWSKANPKESYVATPTGTKAPTLTEKASKIAKDLSQEAAKKQATKETKQLKSLIKEGATPEEAAASIEAARESDVPLSKQDDTKARELLKGTVKNTQGASPSDTVSALPSSNIGIGQSGAKIEQHFATAKEAVAYLVDNGSTDKIKQLATLAARIISKYNVPITYAKAGDKFSAQLTGLISSSYGVVVREAGSDRVSHLYFNTTAEGYNTEEVVLHELLHVALADAIKDPANAAIVQQLESVRKEMLSEISDTMLTDGRSMSDVRKLLANVDELVSVSQTNPYFMEIVQRMAADGRFYSSYRTPADMKGVLEAKPAALPVPVKPTLSLWKKLVSLFAKLLGIPNNYVTAYREQLENYNSIIANNIKAGKFGEDKFIPLTAELDRLVKALADSVDISNPSISEASAKPDVRPRTSTVMENAAYREQQAYESPGLADVITQGLKDGKAGLLDILDYMTTSDVIREDYARLAKRLIPIIKKFDMKFVALTDENNPEGYRGAYNTDTDTILIGDNHPETILHEVLHAISYHILEGNGVFAENSTAKGIRMQMKGLMRHMDIFIKENPDAFTKEELEYIKENALSKDGQLRSIHELLSYTMTNTLGQSIALKVPSRKNIKAIVDNVMTAFVRAIGRIFNFKSDIENTALADLVMLSTKVLDIAEQQSADVLAARDTQVSNKQLPSRPVLERTSKVVKVRGKEFKVANMDTRNSITGAIVDILTAGYGNSKNITEALGRAQGLIGEYVQRAKARFERQEAGLREVAKSRGTNFEEVNKQWNDAISKLEGMTDEDQITQAKESLVRNYGEQAAQSYFANRREIDSISNMIVETRLEDPAPLTPKEVATYLKMKKELGKYYTRAYANNLEGISETYRKDVWDAYKAKQKGTATEAQKVTAQIVENAIDTIKANFVSIPDAGDMEGMKVSELKVLADSWGLNVALDDNMSNDDKVEAYASVLADFRENQLGYTPDMIENRAIALAQELLDDSDGSSLVTYIRGSKQDRTVVEARQQIPESIRKLLGEYDDISLKGMTTVLKQATFLFQTRALGEIRASELAKGDSSKVLSVEEFSRRGLSTEDWVQANGEAFGPLKGMYLEKSLHSKLVDLREVTAPFSELLKNPHNSTTRKAVNKAMQIALENWMKLAGNIKFFQLVVNVWHAALNFMGGAGILASNGMSPLTHPKPIWKAFKTAGDLIMAQGAGTISDEVSLMIRTNQVDNAYMGSLRATEMDKVKLVIKARMGDKAATEAFRKWQRTKEFGRAAKEVYAMADVVWKIAAFYNRLDVLTEFYDAEGIDMSPEAIEREAAANNSMATFSYSHVPKLIKAIEQGGITYIAPFVYESLRAPAASFLLGVSDMKRAASAKTAKGRDILASTAALRMAGTAAAVTIGGSAIKAGIVSLTDAINGDDEEKKKQEQIEAIRPLMADYQKYNDFFVAGKNSEGEYVLFDWSRTDPFGMASEYYRMAAGGAEPEEFLEYTKKLAIKNRYGASILGAMLSFGEEDNTAAKGTRMERWYRPEFVPEQWPSVYETLSAMAGPKVVKTIDKLMPSMPTKMLDTKNEPVDMVSWIAKLTGGELTTVEPKTTLKYAVVDYDKEKDLAIDLLKKGIRTEEVLTTDEYVRTWIEATNMEREAFDKLAKKHKALVALGMKPEEATAALMQAGTGGKGLAKKDAREIEKGTYSLENSLLLSKSSLDAIRADIATSDEILPVRRKLARNFNTSLEAIDKHNLPVRSK